MLIQSRDGTRIAYDASGLGPDLLLVHGSGTAGGRWRPVRPAFEARFTVHAMDRRGHGLSGDAVAYAIEREYHDIACCIENSAHSPIDVVAHSYGAVCALGTARMAHASSAWCCMNHRYQLRRRLLPSRCNPHDACGDCAGRPGGCHDKLPYRCARHTADNVARCAVLPHGGSRSTLAPLALRELETVGHCSLSRMPIRDGGFRRCCC